ncbi:EF-hand domain-containing protein [Pulveribacter suum]
MGGALAHAQPPAPAPSAQIGPSAPTATPTFGPGTAAAPASTTASAFERADTNRDGQLSAAEAAQLPAIGNRFKQLDKDHNGSLSRAEFEAGDKP